MSFVTDGDTKLIAAKTYRICPWKASPSYRFPNEASRAKTYGIREHKVGGDDSRLASNYAQRAAVAISNPLRMSGR